MRSAIVSAAASPVTMASDRSRTLSAESIPIADFAPTPLTDVSFRNIVFSSRVAKPNSSSASSRTLRCVKHFIFSPTDGASASVAPLTVIR